MEENRYLKGELYEYYQEFNGDNVNDKAQEFKDTVNFISNEFENVRNVISNWSGKGALTMSSTMVDNIMERFKIVKNNLNESLMPATQAIENLKKELELMKQKEDDLKTKEKELADLEKNKPPEQIWERGKEHPDLIPNPKYPEWAEKVATKKQEIASLTSELNSIKTNCENYVKQIQVLEASLIDFSYLLGTATTLLGENETSLSHITERLSSYQLLSEDELAFMNDEEKTTLNTLYEQGDSVKLAEYIKHLDKTISKRIYSTPIEERGLTQAEMNFLNDNINDKNKLRIMLNGKEILDTAAPNVIDAEGRITLKEGETVEILVKIPTNNGEHIELCRTGLGRSDSAKNNIIQSNSADPDRYKKSEALQDTGFYIWTITAKKKGKGYLLTQTTQFNTENKQYYNSKDGNGEFKEMLRLYVDVV